MKSYMSIRYFILIILIFPFCQVKGIDYLSVFRDTLTSMINRTDNDFMQLHCRSIILALDTIPNMPEWERDLVKQMYNAFNDTTDTSSAKDLSTYLKRQRPFIITWVSSNDGAISSALLKPPKNWDPQKAYPFYVRLHGQTGDAQGCVKYIASPFINKPSNDSTFDDGYLLSPWGRGNSMYIKHAEKDVWECIDKVTQYIKIDSSRTYLIGLSMGGYGVWHLGTKTPKMWAAFGIYAGVIAYDPTEYNFETAQKIKDVPTYIICGTRDQLYYSNEAAYNWLVEAGNENLEFVTFDGDHEFYNSYVMDMYHWVRNYTNEDWNFSAINEERDFARNYQFYCFPNPVQSGTSFFFELNRPGDIEISIYNNVGQLVESVKEYNLPAHINEVRWEPHGLKAGIYFCTLKLPEITETIKVLIP